MASGCSATWTRRARRSQRGRKVAGDSTMLPETFEGTQSDVARVFGGDFEQALQALPVGSWAGAVESGFGAHLVLVRARQPGRHRDAGRGARGGGA